ncbi:MAG: hypothetical protein R2729_19880 [Bryobacteraceae bacterium]
MARIDRTVQSDGSTSLLWAAPLVCLLLYGRFLEAGLGPARWDAAAYPLLAFATQIVNLFLLAAVARRLDGESAAWFWAPLIWIGQGALAGPMTAPDGYGHLLAATVIATGLILHDRAGAGGGPMVTVAHWAVFLGGLAATGECAVYPAIALAFSAARPLPMRRAGIRHPWFMMLVSLLVLGSGAGTHSLPGSSALGYLYCAVWPACSEPYGMAAAPGGIAAAAVLVASLGALAQRGEAARTRGPFWFGLAWFAMALTPHLFEAGGVSLRHLAAPSAGIAIAIGQLIAPALECPVLGCRLKASLFLALYLPAGWLNALRVSSIPATQARQPAGWVAREPGITGKALDTGEGFGSQP